MSRYLIFVVQIIIVACAMIIFTVPNVVSFGSRKEFIYNSLEIHVSFSVAFEPDFNYHGKQVVQEKMGRKLLPPSHKHHSFDCLAELGTLERMC